MLQPRLIAAVPVENSKLLLTYETGEKRLFDARPYIIGSWYGELSDDAYFHSVSILPGGVGIEWLHGQDIAPHELYELSTLVQ